MRRALAACLVLAAGSCSGDSGDPSGSRLDCADPIDTLDAPPADYAVFGDAVAMLTSDTYDTALQTSRSGDEDASRRLFAKTGLLVRNGAKAELSSEQAWFDWGNTGTTEPTRTLETACEGEGEWIVFPGGCLVADPACVSVTVRVEGVELQYTMGVGAPCPGQQPPPSPSET